MHICGTLVVHTSLPIFFSFFFKQAFFLAKASIRDEQVTTEQFDYLPRISIQVLNVYIFAVISVVPKNFK